MLKTDPNAEATLTRRLNLYPHTVQLCSPASKVFFLSQLSQKFRDLRNLTENANQSLICQLVLPTHPLNPLMRFSNGLGIMSSLLLRMQDESVIRKVQLLHRLLPLHNIPDQKVTHYAHVMLFFWRFQTTSFHRHKWPQTQSVQNF